MTDDFIAPQGWIAREKAVRHIWSLTRKLDLDPDLAREAQHAAEERDDDAFMVAVAEFFEVLGRAEANPFAVGVRQPKELHGVSAIAPLSAPTTSVTISTRVPRWSLAMQNVEQGERRQSISWRYGRSGWYERGLGDTDPEQS